MTQLPLLLAARIIIPKYSTGKIVAFLQMMKKPFDLPIMLHRIEKAVAPYPKAAMFQLYEEGFTSIFEQLISCVVSIRTLDETTIPVSRLLFQKGRTPQQIATLSLTELANVMYGATFPHQKAATILSIAKKAMEEYNGELPADFKVLTSIKGVGPNVPTSRWA